MSVTEMIRQIAQGDLIIEKQLITGIQFGLKAMGNSEEKEAMIKYSVVRHTEEWEKLSSLSYCSIVRNIHTNQIGQSYTIPMKDFTNQVEIYQFRKNNCQEIVAVYSCILLHQQQQISNQQQQISNQQQQHISNQQDISKKFDFINIITESISYRFSEISSIECLEGLYILKSILKGAEIINQKLHNAIYEENMIGINDRGECKIWVNENFSLNSYHLNSNPTTTEEDIVQRLMDFVEKKMYGSQMKEYYAMKLKVKPNDFQTANYFVQFMREKFGEKINKIRIENLKTNSQIKEFKIKQTPQQNLIDFDEKVVKQSNNYSENVKLSQSKSQSKLKEKNNPFNFLPKRLPPKPQKVINLSSQPLNESFEFTKNEAKQIGNKSLQMKNKMVSDLKRIDSEQQDINMKFSLLSERNRSASTRILKPSSSYIFKRIDPKRVSFRGGEQQVPTNFNYAQQLPNPLQTTRRIDSYQQSNEVLENKAVNNHQFENNSLSNSQQSNIPQTYSYFQNMQSSHLKTSNFSQKQNSVQSNTLINQLQKDVISNSTIENSRVKDFQKEINVDKSMQNSQISHQNKTNLSDESKKMQNASRINYFERNINSTQRKSKSRDIQQPLQLTYAPIFVPIENEVKQPEVKDVQWKPTNILQQYNTKYETFESVLRDTEIKIKRQASKQHSYERKESSYQKRQVITTKIVRTPLTNPEMPQGSTSIRREGSVERRANSREAPPKIVFNYVNKN